jgi:hypothetical protein
MSEMFISLTAADQRGTHVCFTGTVIPRPGSTRAELFHDAMRQLAEGTGRQQSELVPLFFALEPNQLPA